MTTHRETIRRISETLATANWEMLKHLRHLSTPQWTELMAEYKEVHLMVLRAMNQATQTDARMDQMAAKIEDQRSRLEQIQTTVAMLTMARVRNNPEMEADAVLALTKLTSSPNP
jgi:DNA-binding transcriptional regulator GbsR (MarR family)